MRVFLKGLTCLEPILMVGKLFGIVNDDCKRKKNGRSAKKALRQGLKPVKIDIYGSKIFNFKILSFFWFLNDPIGIQ